MDKLTLIILAIIAALPGLLTWWNIKKNGQKIQEIHLSVNSRMDELLKAAKGEATAEGRELGRAEQKGK
jgi:hypothetical protein